MREMANSTKKTSKPLKVLITGFGPFPGMPVNPTGPLVEKLATLDRRAFDGIKRTAHIFETSYAAVDRELPDLIARHRPDVLLMFGVAGRTRSIRIETLARNNRSTAIPDATGAYAGTAQIAPDAPATAALPTAAKAMFAAVKLAGLPVTVSKDAGGYLCNYLCWRAAKQAAAPGGPRIAAFVHVPNTRLSPAQLVRAGAAILSAALTLR